MNLPVNPAKVLRLFAPLWLLLAISLWLQWDAWRGEPLLFASIACLPIAAALGAGLARERWRLELTADALVHQTLGRSERFEWARMGPIMLRPAPVSTLLFGESFWFAYPLDAARGVEEHASKLIGRRLLCVFGDRTARETIAEIEAWRALNHVQRR